MRCSCLLHSHLIYFCANFFCIFIAAANLFLTYVSLPESGLFLFYVVSRFSWSTSFCKFWLSWTVSSTLPVIFMPNLSSCPFSVFVLHQLSMYLTLESYPSRVICVQFSFLVPGILLNTNITLTHHHCLSFFALVCGRSISWSSLSIRLSKHFSSASLNPLFQLVHDSVFSSPCNTSPASLTTPVNSLTD